MMSRFFSTLVVLSLGACGAEEGDELIGAEVMNAVRPQDQTLSWSSLLYDPGLTKRRIRSGVCSNYEFKLNLDAPSHHDIDPYIQSFYYHHVADDTNRYGHGYEEPYRINLPWNYPTYTAYNMGSQVNACLPSYKANEINSAGYKHVTEELNLFEWGFDDQVMAIFELNTQEASIPLAGKSGFEARNHFSFTGLGVQAGAIGMKWPTVRQFHKMFLKASVQRSEHQGGHHRILANLFVLDLNGRRSTNIEINLASTDTDRDGWCLNNRDCGVGGLPDGSGFVIGGGEKWGFEVINRNNRWIRFGIHWPTIIAYFQTLGKLPHDFPLNWTKLHTGVYVENVGYGRTRIAVKEFDVGYYH